MLQTKLHSIVEDVVPHTTAVRRELHRHPELGYKEHRTSEIIRRELNEIGVEHVHGLAGGTGVLAYLQATEQPERAPTIALRADMDALPIAENTGKEWASQNPGVMHACGHDGHTAILLGTAKALKNAGHRPNNVKLIFQPAEEGGAGGERMCHDGVMSDTVLGPKVDMVYGLHGWPELPLGSVATRNGPLLAATDEFDITIRGKGCHAAYPQLGVDPIVVASHVITSLQTIASRSVGPLDSVVVTIGEIYGGHARNVIPDEVVLRGTLRTLLPETRALGEKRIRTIAAGVAASFGAEAVVDWSVGYPVTFNDPVATERFRKIARSTLGDSRLIEREHATMGGEDFSFYGHHAPACFFFLGLRSSAQTAYPNLHTPDFDFNDNAIPTAIEVFTQLVLNEL